MQHNNQDGSSINSIDDISFDTDVLENNELIDFQDLIEEPNSPIKKLNQNFHNLPKFPLKNSLSYCKPNLKPVDTNIIANELFQVTNNIRRKGDEYKSYKMYDGESQSTFPNSIFQEIDHEDGFLIGKRLNNEKIDKLVNDLGLKDLDYELDDQFRTRFYKGRFSKNIEQNDDLDMKLDNYLDDKENMMIYDKGNRKAEKAKRGIQDNNFHNSNTLPSSIDHSEIFKSSLSPFPDPIKPKGKGIQKSNKMFFKSPRRQKTSIPVLKPLTNLTNVEIKNDKVIKNEFNDVKQRNFQVKSDKHISIPLHRKIFPSRPSIKYQDKKLNIYIVDSSTGLMNDATKFGTELNASNCEDFPLPENINEIVQIPTNDDINAKHQKMAIIKVFQNQYFKNELALKASAGYYTQNELENFKISANKENDTPNHDKELDLVNNEKPNSKKKKVQWANELEW